MIIEFWVFLLEKVSHDFSFNMKSRKSLIFISDFSDRKQKDVETMMIHLIEAGFVCIRVF